MRVLKFLDAYLEESIVVIMLAGMTFLVGLQVVMRYVMQDSLSWSEEMARYLFIWLVNIGISYGVKKNRHISIDVLNTFLSRKKAAILSITADFVFFIFSVMIVYNGYDVAQRIMRTGQASPAIELPMTFVYSALPAGFLLVCIRLLQSIIGKITLMRQGKYEDIQ